MKTCSIGHLSGPIVALALAFVLVGLAAPAGAQSSAKVNIEFAFVAGGTDFPAGAYTVEADAGKISLRSADAKGKSAMMLAITRLGRHDTDKDAELIFDKVNGKLMLSEIWLANADGYLVLNTPGDHEHRVLGGSKPHK